MRIGHGNEGELILLASLFGSGEHPFLARPESST